MKLVHVLWLVSVLVVTPSVISAFTIQDAERCARMALEAYEKKIDRTYLIAYERVVPTAVGPGYRRASPAERELLIRTARTIAREVLMGESTYEYSNLRINRATQYESGQFRVDGRVFVTTPERALDVDFFALVAEHECKIFQVRMEGIATLTGQFRERLQFHPDTQLLMHRLLH